MVRTIKLGSDLGRSSRTSSIQRTRATLGSGATERSSWLRVRRSNPKKKPLGSREELSRPSLKDRIQQLEGVNEIKIKFFYKNSAHVPTHQ